MSTNNFIASVPKLRGRENYSEWAFAVENFLLLDGLNGCIKEETAEAADKIAQARAKLILTIDPALFIHVKETKTAAELWKKLKSLYDDAGFARKISLLRSLISVRLENMDNMASYVNRLIETAQRLRGTGFHIDDEWIGSLLLAGLPDKFAPMIMAIEHSGTKITADSVKTKLLEMEDDSNKGASAFVGKVGWHKKSGYNKTNKFGNKCQTSGVTHSNETSVRKEIRCYKCKQIGHVKSNCPSLKSNNNQATPNVFSAIFLSGQTFNKNDWYLDSGASVHITANKNWFTEAIISKWPMEIQVADKTKLAVECMGNLNITTVVDNKTFDVLVKDVLYVPDIATNLISVSQLIKNGNRVIFDNDGCKIFRGNQLIAKATLMDNMYKLNIETPEQCCLATVSGEIWHRRLAHINEKELKRMANGAVDGMICKGEININKHNCETCNEGKQTRLPFPHTGSHADNILDIIHTDLCGPMEEKSIGGAKYFLIFEDDFTKMAFVYFLKTKDEVFEYFKQFKSMVENQTERKIKTLRSDNGGEFCGTAFEDFLKKAGIVHQKSNPYSPEQNGSAERLNRTIVEKARCMLFDAKLDKKFWAEAVNTAVYIRNRSTTSSLANSKTPFEMWYGKKPDIGNLRIFGSKVMTHIPKTNRLKWDKKSKKTILVGYSESCKGYRLYDPDINNVTICRDVEILEKSEELVEVITGGNQETAVSVRDPAIETPMEKVEANQLDENSSESVSISVCEDTSDEEYVSRKPSTVTEQRSSKRLPKPKDWKDFVTYSCVENSYNEDPLTMEEALARPDSEMWKRAISEELKSFEENDAWKIVQLPEKASVVKCKWVFKRKVSCDGKVTYRARLVAKGFSQKHGIDYDETFSPVVRHSSLRLLFALSVKLGLEINHLDVKTAFLNGFLNECVYMQMPEGFSHSGYTNKCLKLNKAIYGLKQASKAWNDRVNEVLLDMHYQRSKYEPCIYTKKQNNLITIIALYVDDFFVFSNNVDETDHLKKELGSKFKLKDLGRIKECLGMQVHYDVEGKVITLSQKNYINLLLKKFNMLDTKTFKTPMEVKLNLDNNETSDSIRAQYPYQKLIGCLMYLSILTRPDISYSVSYLSQFNNSYNETHWKYAKRVLKYLKATENYCLRYTGDNSDLQGFADADWAANSIDRRSYTGYAFKLCGSVVSWESSKQKTIALSSSEAEYMSLSEAAKEAIYLKGLLMEITANESCITLFNDNQSAIKLTSNPVFHKRSKHIDVRHHFLRDLVANKTIRVEYLCTEMMPADILTKSLCWSRHYKLMNLLGIINHYC